MLLFLTEFSAETGGAHFVILSDRTNQTQLPKTIKIEAVVKITGQSLNGRKLILNPVNRESNDNVLSIAKEIQ